MELLILLAIILLLFGAKRLPQVGRSLGSGIREFRKAIGGGGDDKDGVQDRKKEDEEEPSLNGAARAEAPRSEEGKATRTQQKS
jgi:TatA/E family protein of Tat protein translocase